MNTTHFGDLAGMMRTVATGRCPACARAPAFKNLYRLHDTCPACGVRFERDEGSFLGSLAVTYGLSIVALAGFALLTIPRFGLSNGVVAGLTAVAIASVLALYRPAKAWWLWWLWAAGFVYRDDAAARRRHG